MTAYYSENDPVAAHVLCCLIDDGLIAPGIVDDRSIKDVDPNDLRGFAQCHFFAGAGTWSVAARLAGWADERPIWTASCPCQPFSAAGKGDGTDDPRHLWPDVFRLIRGAKAGGFGPAVLMGEQVSGKAGYGWFDGVRADLAQEGYASRARDIPALAVDGPHQRNRLYWIAVADADAGGRAGWTEGAERSPEQRVVAEWPADEYLADRHQPVGLEQQQAGQQPLVQHHARDDGGRDAVEHAKGERRREGRPEHELRSGRSTLASADVSGVTQGDAFRAGLEGHAGHGDERGRQIEAGSVAPADGCGGRLAERYSIDGRSRAGWSNGPEAGNAHDARRNGSFWADAEWIICHDGKARRTKPDLRLLVDGMAGRIHLWRLAGNSIVAEEAAEVIRAFMEAEAMSMSHQSKATE